MDLEEEKSSNSLKNNYLRDRYFIALFFSLVFHLLIFLLSYNHIEKNISKTRLLKKQPKIVYINLAPLKEKKKKKIYVPQSSSKPQKLAKKTNQLSKNNSFVLKEQIKRGENNQTASVIKKAPKPIEQVKSSPSSKSNQRIKLGSSDLIFDESLTKEDNLQARSSLKNIKKNSFKKDELKKRTQKLKSSRPFRNPSSSLSSLNSGSNAYLPKIPDGNITLLNSKADKHAVFVSRIALQVFGKLKNLCWAQLTSREINKIREYVTVTAKMSRSGKFLGAKVTESSGFEKFDNALFTSAKEGTWDQNPPLSAKAETGDCLGNICFIFKARVWSKKLANNQIEKRWMIMGTGLE